jgi:nicotinamide riboside kinase
MEKDFSHPTLVVNLMGGPCSGKSTTAADLFARLKWANIRSELVSEYAKHVTWEQATFKLTNQVYLFGKQHHKQFILKDKVRVIVTDSPIVLGGIYDNGNTMYLKELMISEFNKFWNLNVFLERQKEYDAVGRNQTLEQAIEKDNEILYFLRENKISHIGLPGTQKSVDIIYNKILHMIGEAHSPIIPATTPDERERF